MESVRGTWVLQYRSCCDEYYLCSHCNTGRVVIYADRDDYALDDFKFCPHCGIPMFVGESNDTNDT